MKASIYKIIFFIKNIKYIYIKNINMVTPYKFFKFKIHYIRLQLSFPP